MAETDYILAISVDFARLEAALVDTAGRIAHIETAPMPIVTRGAGMAFADPSQLLERAGQTIRALIDRKPREARRIAGVGLTGRSPSVCLVGESGPKRPFVLPGDRRAEAAAAAADVCWEEVHRRTGLTAARCEIPFVIGGSTVSSGDKFLTPKDFLKWALTGEFSTDVLDAQRTFLWDLAEGEWSEDLCGMFGANPANLPGVSPAAAAAGKVTERAARATGVRAGLPVSCGMGDWGEYLGSGVYEVSDAFEHIGTTAAFYGVSDSVPPAEMGLEVRPHVKDGLYLVGREGLPGGACIEWLLEKSFLARGGVIDWPAVEEELEAIAAMGKPENVLFFPNLAGRAPQLSEAAFLNMRVEDNLTSLIQGLIEGLFFNLKAVAEELKTMPWTLGAVYTTGQVGFKHAPRRTRAHIYGVRVHAGRMAGANLVSAALVGAVACGVFSTLEEARSRMLNIDGGTVPDEHVQKLYEAHFASWLGTRDLLTPGGPPAGAPRGAR